MQPLDLLACGALLRRMEVEDLCYEYYVHIHAAARCYNHIVQQAMY